MTDHGQTCPSCGAFIEFPGALFCTSCGAETAPRARGGAAPSGKPPRMPPASTRLGRPGTGWGTGRVPNPVTKLDKPKAKAERAGPVESSAAAKPPVTELVLEPVTHAPPGALGEADPAVVVVEAAKPPVTELVLEPVTHAPPGAPGEADPAVVVVDEAPPAADSAAAVPLSAEPEYREADPGEEPKDANREAKPMEQERETAMGDKAAKCTLIEEGTRFKGSLESTCPVLVRGRVEGEVQTPSLTVSSTGGVHGKVSAGKIQSEGELSGEFDAEAIELAGAVKDNTVIRAQSLKAELSARKGKMQIMFAECEAKAEDSSTQSEGFKRNGNGHSQRPPARHSDPPPA